jgi:hypothetical protein
MQYTKSKEICSVDTIPDKSCLRKETDYLLATLTAVERRWIYESCDPLAAHTRSLLAINDTLTDDPALLGELYGVIEQIIKTGVAYSDSLFRLDQRTLNVRQMGDVLQNHICWLEYEMIKANKECNNSRYEFLEGVYNRLRMDVLERP